MEEPSILDYVKALLSFGRIQRPEIPPVGPAVTASPAEITAEEADAVSQAIAAPAIQPTGAAQAVERPATAARTLPWRALLSVFVALVAQRLLDPSSHGSPLPIFLYLASGGMLVWSILAQEWRIAPAQEGSSSPFSLAIRPTPLYVLLPFLLAAFLAFGGNRFTDFNLLLWAVCLVLLYLALWLPGAERSTVPFAQRVRAFLSRPFVANIRITWWGLLLAAVALMAVFFRFYQLGQVPGEMFSDHAEKLLDVSDVLNGKTAIFFPRNTGREAIQMYLTAAIAKLFGFGLTFISLKIGTALAGLLALPFIYLTGKEVGNRWVGLLAVTLAAFAYWPNVISRVGLRFPLYPLFAAPMLFFLLRGLRTQNRNDFVLAGLALGMGLHGYSPMRITPFIVVVAVGLYLLHAQSSGKRRETFWALVGLAFVSFVIFLPLFRYMLSDPEMFGYRAFTRLGSAEQPLPGPALQIFGDNLWKASIMFFANNGNIWVHSVTNRPALDVISAAFLFLGALSLLVRYVQKRHWLDLFLLFAAPLFMLPSILSLAFPGENPSLNRTGAAIVPVFVIAAIGLEAFLSALMRAARAPRGKAVVAALALLLVGLSARQNYDLVFHQYKLQFLGGAWNTGDMGRVIREFADTVGTPDTAYVIPYPHWVDTRLVGIHARDPLKDYALWAKDFEATLSQPNPKLFLLKPEDEDSLAQLRRIYPQGILRVYRVTRFEGKDFLMYFVPPGGENAALPALDDFFDRLVK